jgi:hypothetical protein
MSYFIRTTETGAYEAPSQTIGALIEREWVKARVDNTIPKFIYDQNSTNPSNITDMMEAIVFSDAGTFNVPERTALGHGLIGMGDIIVITVFAGSQKRRKLFEFEIYRILRKNRPIANNVTPIKKSDRTSNSSIHDYDEIMPEFVAFNDGVEGREKSNKSSAILSVISEWLLQ